MASAKPELNLAVLIDAENVPYHCIKSIMEEVAIYGTPTVKRIYGDWTSPNIARWKQPLLENAITPIQQYSYTQGKNSSDSAMIIDAMDILYAGNTDGFVLVSSDSDFTRLAIRLREAGKRVIGIGERKTPNAFIVSCDKFIYIDVIRTKNSRTEEKESEEKQPEQPAAKKTRGRKKQPEQPAPTPEPVQEPPKKTSSAQQSASKTKAVPSKTVELIAESVDDLAGDDDWVFMGDLGTLLCKKQPDFDPRNYGFKSLSALVKSVSRFKVDFRPTADPSIKHPYVKDEQR